MGFRFRRSTLILLLGAIVAGLCAAGGLLNELHLERREAAAQVACEEESAHPKEGDKFAESATLTCDEDLSNLPNLIGVQGELNKARKARREAPTWPAPVAIVIFGGSLAYWAWYFLLRRISELRAAIGGKPPEH